MDMVFKSILKDELASFMEFIKLSIVDWKAFYRTLVDIDSFLFVEGLMEKRIEAQQISRWFNGQKVSLSTKKSRLSHIKRFSSYLATLGIKISLPELPRNNREFKPYVFSTDEITQIFEMADDFIHARFCSRVLVEFPMLLRILYGCGLRLGEALSLTWNEIDLSTGVITVKIAKNQKQRIVPMNSELTRILNLYRMAPLFDSQDQGFLFRNNNGQQRSKGAYWSIFNTILCELGIKNTQTKKYGSRGPCMHSLRHTFAFHSLLKADAEGRGFMETVPFLSTYLGHGGLMETDKYLKARHGLYAKAHTVISDYTRNVFPQEI